MLAYLTCTGVKVLINSVALKLGVPVSCRFLFFRIYTPLRVCALWSVAVFVRCFRKHHTFLQSCHRQFTSRPSSSQGFFSYGLSCISGFYTFPGRPFWRKRSETSVECCYALSTCLAGQKGRMRFFLNIFRKKRIRPFWPTASLSKYCRFSCALKASPIYLWKTVSCNSEFLSHSLRCVTSIYFWTIVIIYNPAALWFAVPWAPFFNSFFSEAGRKTAGLLQVLFWFRGQAEPLVNSSSWLDIRVTCACPNTKN